MVCYQDQTTADAGHKRQTHPLPSIGHHPIWRINMIQSNNRSFKNKPLSNIQQAQFSIGWRFCPVCGHKLYQKDESCSGTIRIKCLKCGNGNGTSLSNVFGCGNGDDCGCGGGCGNNSCIWLILILLFCGGGCGF